MRLDKFLKISRIIKRRTVANEVADSGMILVNGKKAKPSYDIKPNDIIEIQWREKPIQYKVLRIPEKIGKDIEKYVEEL